MAVVETVAVGVPLLSTSVGVLGIVLENTRYVGPTA